MRVSGVLLTLPNQKSVFFISHDQRDGDVMEDTRFSGARPVPIGKDRKREGETNMLLTDADRIDPFTG